MVGSLSGGCVEDDLKDKLLAGELAAEHLSSSVTGLLPKIPKNSGYPAVVISTS